MFTETAYPSFCNAHLLYTVAHWNWVNLSLTRSHTLRRQDVPYLYIPKYLDYCLECIMYLMKSVWKCINLMMLYQTAHLPRKLIRIHRELWYIYSFHLELRRKPFVLYLLHTWWNFFLKYIPIFWLNTQDTKVLICWFRVITVPCSEHYTFHLYSFQVL